MVQVHGSDEPAARRTGGWVSKLGGGWPGLRRAFQLPFSRNRIRKAVVEELQFHIEGRVEQFVASGIPREEAEAEARRRFGDFDGYQREARNIDERHMRQRNRLRFFDALKRETHHAARSLLRAPSFALIALVTLAVGIGATTAIYTILEAVVLRPLPYSGAEQLVSVLHPTTVPGTGDSKWGLSAAGYFYFKNENRTLADMGAFMTGYSTVSGEGDAERVRSASVTNSVLSVLRAQPALGRLIVAGDDKPGAPPVVMLGYEFWKRRYGGDPGAIGKVLETSSGPAQVIGVTAKGFNLPKPGPFASGNDLGGFQVDLWLPLQLDPAARAENSHSFFGVGRLKAGLRAAEAQQDMEVLARRLTELFPSAYTQGFIDDYRFRIEVQPLRDEVLGERITRTLWILFGAVGLLLLIACANVANLFLVRMEARRRESAIRHALGAARAHLAVYHLAESLLLTLVAGAAGLALAAVFLRVLLVVAPAELPRLSEVGLGWTAVSFAVALSVVAGVIFGLLPVFRVAADLSSLRDGSRGLTPSARRRAARSGLVVAQVALALMLLTAAGLLVRSFAHLRAVHPGLDPTGVLAFTIAIPSLTYSTMEEAASFHRAFQARLMALPGVQHAGAATGLPLRDFGTGCSIVFREGLPYKPDESAVCVATPKVTPGFFDALGIRVDGRKPEWRDLDTGTGVVVVTKALADRLWPGKDPVGQGINSNGGDKSGYYRVVGVIPELRANTLDKPPTEAVFYPAVAVPKSWIWGPLNGATYVVRTSSADPAALTPAIRRTLSALDPRVPLANVTTMQAVLDRSMARTSFIMLLLGIAAGIALLLSAVGLYGVISYVVSQRRHEIGLRMALGAMISDVARLVVVQTVKLAVIGVLLGLAGSIAGMRMLRSLLFGVSPTDPLVFALVPMMLIATAALASLAPARRAARVDPVEALRSQ